MRIGLVVYDNPGRSTGGFIYDRRLVEGLRASGDHVTVIPVPWKPYPRALFDGLRQAWRTRVTVDDVDVVLQDELCHPVLVRAVQSPRDVPVLSIVHHLRSSEPHPVFRNTIYRFVERRYLRGVDGFVYTSQSTRRSVEQLVGETPGLVAPPAGDRFNPHITSAEIRERAIQSGPLRIVFLGQVIPRKGLHTLLTALAALPSGEVMVTVIGDDTAAPSYVNRIRTAIDRYSLHGTVTLTGQVSDHRVADHLASSHLLAVPSSYEGYGIVYLEAMGFGLPAIGTTQGGAREIITHGENGFLVPPDEPMTITRTIKTLIEDRDRLGQVGVAARARFHAQPGWEKTVRSIRSYIHQAVEQYT